MDVVAVEGLAYLNSWRSCTLEVFHDRSGATGLEKVTKELIWADALGQKGHAIFNSKEVSRCRHMKT